jgi:2-polyprenyl-3-methyl-5-hydroxy-6-metoxy-1,4-benzoquinol methylase
MLTALHSWKEVERVFADGQNCETEAARVALLCDYYYDTSGPLEDDPFGSSYLQRVVRLHSRITGREGYKADEDELSPFLGQQATDLVARPSPYGWGDSEALGELFISWGFMLRVLALPPGSSVLEYGPGGGQIAISLARNGLDVSVVDVEPRYISAIEEQCRRLGVPITAMVGTFGDVPTRGKQYDAVLFFESFHHSLEHAQLLRRLQHVVSDDGVIALAGEPIIEAGSYWEPTIPFAWGPRCDLLSLWAMRTYGWMELGFREWYFFEAARRAGWAVRKEPCALTSRGTTYLLRREAVGTGIIPRLVRQLGRVGRPGFGRR